MLKLNLFYTYEVNTYHHISCIQNWLNLIALSKNTRKSLLRRFFIIMFIQSYVSIKGGELVLKVNNIYYLSVYKRVLCQKMNAFFLLLVCRHPSFYPFCLFFSRHMSIVSQGQHSPPTWQLSLYAQYTVTSSLVIRILRNVRFWQQLLLRSFL